MVKLRPLAIQDLKFLNKVRNLSREMLHDDREFTFEQTFDWFTKTQPRFFLIESEQEPVGYVRTSQWDEENCTVYIGIDIAPEHRRKGYARAAYHLILDALFASGMRTIFLEVLANNGPAMKLYQELGFHTTDHVEQMAQRNGGYIDGFKMSLHAHEWESMDRIHYLTYEEMKQMNAPFPPEEGYESS